MNLTTTTLAPEHVKARSRAATVQKVVSPGGVEAWLVEDYAVPLVALEFAFKGGASQDPRGKPGAANAARRPARRRRGPVSTPRASTARSTKRRSNCPSRPIATC